MTIKVLVKKEVSNKLDELPNDLKKRIRTALNEAESMWPTCRLDIKKLKGYDNHYRIRVGDYRILFFREEGTAKIYDISHRSDVYK
ncbi:type II toxin-antitoxin system RelE/ParE family toxin [Candidatus Nitrosotenuis chungbukensis]|uniref:type II toxin-antitoxin system RelE family toxin n=1 Tax=Candidatus Nitrosotenuis chungbukensis TaxID=1353246 RepID=UPI0026738211|nr:type II toxin-antitoxin system RelE/ParE family toxin [Candidatus Nitrosotenuis chungbukensis]WKT57527.1 type II toxin-antitoxin system RelE/ParE family toxin [Candidatus Nitrosotenuis chungbukensis]